MVERYALQMLRTIARIAFYELVKGLCQQFSAIKMHNFKKIEGSFSTKKGRN